MASPFPGMDPYLEQYWRDIHARLIIYAADQLQGHLPGDLRARVEERVLVESPESSVAVAEPLVIYRPDEPMTETYIETPLVRWTSTARAICSCECFEPRRRS